MRRWLVHALVLVLAGITLVPPPAGAADRPYAPGQVLVRYQGSAERELKLPAGIGVPEAVRRLRAKPRVAYANPDYVVTAAALPNDPGSSGNPGDWTKDQWNFLSPSGSDLGGVAVPEAWQNLRLVDRAGGKGTIVAVLDTGVAYRRLGQRFRHDPDLPPSKRFVAPKDFVDGDQLPVDQNGHGTHVTSTIAQATNNGLGLTGIAYGAKVMPIRVLDRHEKGTGRNVARGIRYAVDHGADVINLSLEFTPQVNRCAQIVGVCDAVHKAIQHGVVVIAAAGNHHRPSVAFPARAPGAIAVGATTYRSCLADYSDYGKGLDLVAPGGGVDTALGTGDGACDHTSPGYGIRQFSLNPTAASNGNYHKFGIVGLHGTSMSAAHVSGVAAMMRAVGWQPDAIESRLEGCARQVGDPTFYGAGILDAAKSSWIGACP